MSRSRISLLFLLLLLGSPAGAQIESPFALPQEALRMPIHTQEDDPVGGAYGFWAAGSDYKVSFGREVSFVPMLGTAYESNLPLTWRTVEASVDDVDLMGEGDGATSSYTDWRWVLRHANVEERWDVRPEGVEVSWVIVDRPERDGDLVIRGRVTSELWATPRAPEQGPIVFHAFDGRPIVNFGEAYLVDAQGDVLPIATGFDGDLLSLHVRADVLANAAYPIVIDPLLTRIPVMTHADPPGASDIARDDENDHRLVSFTRRASLTDWDLWSILITDAGSHVTLHYGDVSANWSTNYPSAGHIAGADRWALAFERYFPVFDRARIRCHVRDAGVGAVQGPVLSMDENPDQHHRYPTISVGAGFSAVDRALLVFQQDAGVGLQNSANSRIVGTFLDGANQAFEPSLFFVSSTTGDLDCEFPSASRIVQGPHDTWVVTWQQFNNGLANDDWDVWGRQIHPSGAFSDPRLLDAASSGRHALYPKIDGREGLFLLYHGESPRNGKSHADTFTELVALRVDWPFGSDPVSSHFRILHQDALAIFGYGEPNARPMAYDSDTRSHWTIGSIRSDRTLALERLGYDLGVVESRVAYSVPFDLVRGVSITHDDDHDTFATFFAVQQQAGNHPVFLQDLAYENARSLYFGSTCQGSVRAVHPGVGDRPHAGSEFFAVALETGLPNAPTGLFVSHVSANLSLGNGCSLLLDPSHFFLLTAGTSDANGDMTVPVPLPTDPFARGDVYWQWIQFDGASGDIRASDGLLTEIR